MCAFVQLVNFSCCCFGKNPQWPRPSHILVRIHGIGKKSLIIKGRCNCPAANTVYCVCGFWKVDQFPDGQLYICIFDTEYNCLESCFYAYVIYKGPEKYLIDNWLVDRWSGPNVHTKVCLWNYKVEVSKNIVIKASTQWTLF